MSDTLSLPFSGSVPIARHHSYLAAKSASATRVTKSLQYLDALQEAGEMGLTDHQIAALFGWPMGTVCSVRNGCIEAGLVVARTDAHSTSPYGKKNTIWRRRA